MSSTPQPWKPYAVTSSVPCGSHGLALLGVAGEYLGVGARK